MSAEGPIEATREFADLICREVIDTRRAGASTLLVANSRQSASAPISVARGARTLTVYPPRALGVRIACARSGETVASSLPNAPRTRRLHAASGMM